MSIAELQVFPSSYQFHHDFHSLISALSAEPVSARTLAVSLTATPSSMAGIGNNAQNLRIESCIVNNHTSTVTKNTNVRITNSISDLEKKEQVKGWTFLFYFSLMISLEQH